MPEVKPWYLSKTILVNILMGLAMVIASFAPEVGAFIKENFAEAGGAWAFVNIILRIITKKEIA